MNGGNNNNFPRMRETVFFALTLSGLCVAIYKDYHYIKNQLTWTQAQSFCRQMYSDLATIENPDDNKAISNIQELLNFVWIGYSDDLSIWKWALGNVEFDNYVDYDSWGLKEPYDQRSGSRCAVMTQVGYWHDIACENLRFAVCFYEQGFPTYVFVGTAMTWHQAREYCRSFYTDLVSVRNLYENDEVSSLVLGDAWIGLHRQPWAWSDSSSSNFTNWSDVEPASSLSMTCCAKASTTTGLWWQADCEEEHYFICQAVYYSESSVSTAQDNAKTTTTTTTTTYKLKFKSEEDLTDPAVQHQVLKQLHAKLKTRSLADFKLQWIQTDEQTLSKKQEDGGCPSVFAK